MNPDFKTTMKIENIETRSAEETENAAAAWARNLRAGEVVALYGDLGAGKTCWVKGMARGLGMAIGVHSPTFTLINEYPTQIPLYHFDLYRLNSWQELEDLDVEEYFYGEGIAVLEWAEKAGQLLPPDHWRIQIQTLNEDTRRIEIQWPASRSKA